MAIIALNFMTTPPFGFRLLEPIRMAARYSRRVGTANTSKSKFLTSGYEILNLSLYYSREILGEQKVSILGQFREQT